jgi:PII-like signaling protein
VSLIGERVLLRFYLRAADRAPWAPTWERVVRGARREGLAGATVIKGILGVGGHGELRPSAWALTEHAPVIVEVVDVGERVVAFLKRLMDEGELAGGLVTLERAAVMMYRHGPPAAGERGASLELAGLLEPRSTVPRIEPRDDMMINDKDGVLLRVFIGESDRQGDLPLYEAIVRKVRELGLAGATVLRGIEGYGAHSVVHRASIVDLSADLPIVVEVVDSEEKIRGLLPHLEGMVGEGMITMEYVVVLAYRHGAKGT